MFSTKVNLLHLLYLKDCYLLLLIKQNCLLKNFSKNTNLDDSGISLPAFPSRINLKLYKEVITYLDSSKMSGADCIPVLVLKKSERELFYILTKIFNMYLKESCFSDCLVLSVVPVFKNIGERSIAKNTALLVFENLVNNRFVEHLRKCGLFLISSTTSGLLGQLQIFLQVYVIKLQRLLIGLGLLVLWSLIYPTM